MTYDADYTAFVTRVDELTKWSDESRGPSAPSLVESWERMVDEAEHGYGMNLEEWSFDLWHCRRVIQKLLDDEQLRSLRTGEWFFERIRELDERYKAVAKLRPNASPDGDSWWTNYWPTSYEE